MDNEIIWIAHISSPNFKVAQNHLKNDSNHESNHFLHDSKFESVFESCGVKLWIDNSNQNFSWNNSNHKEFENYSSSKYEIKGEKDLNNLNRISLIHFES